MTGVIAYLLWSIAVSVLAIGVSVGNSVMVGAGIGVILLLLGLPMMDIVPRLEERDRGRKRQDRH